MSFRSSPTCCHDLRRPSRSYPHASAVRQEATFQGSTYSWIRATGSRHSAQSVSTERAARARPTPRSCGAIQYLVETRAWDMSPIHSPICPTARSVAASAIANEYPVLAANRERCRSIYARASLWVPLVGTVVMRGMSGSDATVITISASRSSNGRRTTPSP